MLRAVAAQDGSGVSTAELVDRLQSVHSCDGPSARQIIDKLNEEGVIRPLEGSGDDWELPAEVRDDIRWLCDRQRVMTPGLLRGVIDDLDYRQQELDDAVSQRDVEIVLDVIGKIKDVLGDIAGFSRRNRRAVVAEVMAIKAKDDGRTLRQRYRIVADLHHRFVEPMREIVDDRGPLRSVLDALEATLRLGITNFESDSSLPLQLEQGTYRAVSLARQTRDDFAVSSSEVSPLYNQYRRDTLLTEAAAACLERFHREGTGFFDVNSVLPVASFRTEGLFSAADLKEFLESIGEQVRSRCERVRLPGTRAGERQRVISHREVEEAIRGAVPISDLLTWLFRRYDEVSENAVLYAFGEVLMDSRFMKGGFAPSAVETEFQGVRYRYHPVEVFDVHG